MTENASKITIWLVTGPIMVLYLAAGTIVFLLCEINDRICSVTDAKTAQPSAVTALLSFVSNLLGVASLILLATALDSPTRLSMIIFPFCVLFLRYGNIIERQPLLRAPPAAALGGSASGILLGAWLFMRHGVIHEPVTRVPIPGNVQTIPVQELIHRPGDWSVSLNLVFFYLVSLAIFFLLHAMLKKSAPKQLSVPEEKRKEHTFIAVCTAFCLNFLGVVILVLLARYCHLQLRLAMVLFPLALIGESYWVLMRADPRQKSAHWTGFIGTSLGMLVGMLLLMRDMPLH